jgi:ABC-2 type transport system permease protein
MNWQHVLAIVYRNFIVIRRNLFRLFDITLWPLILFLSLTLFVDYLNQDASVIGMVILGVMGWRAVYHAQIEFAQSYMDQHWSGMLGHLLVSPIKIKEFLLGNLLLGLGKFVLVCGGYVFLATFMFDYSFSNIPLIALGLASLLLFGFIIGLFTLGICFIYHENAFAISYILPDLIVLSSGVYYPITVFPTLVQKVVVYFPTYYSFEILKASIGLGTVNLSWLFGTLFVWFIAGVVFLKWTIRYTRKNGMYAHLN